MSWRLKGIKIHLMQKWSLLISIHLTSSTEEMDLIMTKNMSVHSSLTAIYWSPICMTVRLGWTDCHTFVFYLYDSKARVD